MRNRKFLLKTIAIFLAVNISLEVLAPTLAMALTSGPTTPEVSSFEPVDTTDMVNLATGDFTYNIPLLDVPGPEGGYPLALSYHAGILPSQDASWVGLGWNLNPGSINRTVNNIPDDFNGYYSNAGYGAAQYAITDQWNGGRTSETNIGVGVTLYQVLSVGVDVGIKNDTYRGMGGSFGIEVGAGFGAGSKGALSVGAGFGYDSWDGIYVNANAGVGIVGKSGSAGLGVGMDSRSGAYIGLNIKSSGEITQGLSVGISEAGGAYASVGISEKLSQAGIGINLSSSGVNFSANGAGQIMYQGRSGNTGKINTASGDFSFKIPIYIFYLSLGLKYTRYWMYQQSRSSLVGVLNGKGRGNTPYWGDNFDCTVLQSSNTSMVDEPRGLDWTANPTVATYDSYSVLGQGLSGSIEPVVLDNGSFFRKLYNEYNNGDDWGPEMKTDIYRQFTKSKHFFRFKNDFSNSHRITNAPGFNFSGGDLSYDNTDLLGYSLASMDPRGYKKEITSGAVTEVRFAGSRHIEYFTNKEITDNVAKAAGFINAPNATFADRNQRTQLTYNHTNMPGTYDISSNIGGYMITNEKGVTYHYALPAYTFGFEQQSNRYGPSGSITQRNIENPAPYAYTWMLTAITGPDYIDKNSNGLLDVNDLGYWVEFEYGKWHDRSGFRTPETGTNTDVDGSSVISSGFKEVYYLDAIKTRSHTALFIKDMRSDGKGTSSFDAKNFDSGIRLLSERRAINMFPDEIIKWKSFHKPISMMQLKEVLLLDNATLNSFYTQHNLWTDPTTRLANILKSQNSNSYLENGEYSQVFYWSVYSGAGENYAGSKMFHNWANVLNTTDFNTGQLEDLRSKSYKRFEFTYDYSLCPNTINSFDTDQNVNLGKLTLKKLKCFGRNNVQLMPSTNFNYEIDNIPDGSAAITWVPGAPGWSSDKRLGRIYTDMGSAPNLKEGDIVKFTHNSKVYYISLIRLLPNPNTYVREYDVLYLGKENGDRLMFPNNRVGNTPEGAVINVDLTLTKNPPYTPGFTDLWGFFKSDYKDVVNSKNNKAHQTTKASAAGVDCWSLRSIETPTGATVNVAYESDDYYNVALKNLPILNTLVTGLKIKFTGTSTFYSPQALNKDHWMGNTFSPFYGRVPLSATEYIISIDPKDLQYPLGDYVKAGDKVMMSKYSEFDIYNPNGDPIGIDKPYHGKGMIDILEVDEVNNTIRFSDPGNDVVLAPMSKIHPEDPDDFVCEWFRPGPGFITLQNRTRTPGGGIRAASVSVTDGATTHTTKYEYSQTTPNGEVISWGSTAYEPSSMDDLIIERFENATDEYMKSFKRSYYKTYEDIFASAQDLAAPGVIYETVKVKGSVTKSGVTTVSPTYQSYRFQAFKREMVEFTGPPLAVSGRNTIANWTIADKTSGIGNLLSVRTYDKFDHLLSETSNTYTNNAPNDQGRVDQVFHEQRRMDPDHGAQARFGVQTITSEYPSVLLSTTTRDFVKGYSSTTTNVAFDYFSGAVTETESKDSYGNTVQSITIPAYNWYSGMGLKLHNVSNANMLSQASASYVVRKTSIGASYPATVASTNNPQAPFEVQATLSSSLKLPMTYHEGSKVLGLSMPVFITWISPDRTSFKVISRAATVSTDLGSKTFSFTNGSVMNASINTWSKQWTDWAYNGTVFAETAIVADNLSTVQNEQVWRKQSDYAWNSPYLNTDGTYKNTGTGSFVPFDYTASTQTSPYWANVNTNTRYSRNSKPLEAKDINNTYSSVKYCSDENYVLALASNSKYPEFTHSGAEYTEPTSGYTEGEVLGSAFRENYVSMYAHSGSGYFRITPSSMLKYTVNNGPTTAQVLKSSGAYKASVWVHKSSIANAQLYANVYTNGSLTASPVAVCNASTIKCGDFYYLTLDFTGPGGNNTGNKIEVGVKNIGASGSIYVDDFRFQPEVSSVTSYVYDKNTGMLTHVLGNDNRYTRYQYDTRYKLKAVYKETTTGEVKVSENTYNYARPLPD